MSPIGISVIGFTALPLLLLIVRVPVGVAMLVVGLGGHTALDGAAPLLNSMKTAAYWRFASYDFSVIPMFLLMG